LFHDTVQYEASKFVPHSPAAHKTITETLEYQRGVRKKTRYIINQLAVSPRQKALCSVPWIIERPVFGEPCRAIEQTQPSLKSWTYAQSVLEKVPGPRSTEPVHAIGIANWTRARYVKEAQGASWVIHQESADDVVLVADATPYDSIGTKQEPCVIDPSRA
jgi:hypothetical protein